MDRVLRDYEIQLAAMRQQDRQADAREVYRAEYARVRQIDRLAAQEGEDLTVGTAGERVWRGCLISLGLGWIQLKTEEENVVIPQQAIVWWEGGNRFSCADPGPVTRQLSLGYTLRALSLARIPVRIFYTCGGDGIEGSVENVGMDFVEVALHRIEGAYRSKKILGLRVIPFDGVAAVCSAL